jgi:hypothetical protein
MRASPGYPKGTDDTDPYMKKGNEAVFNTSNEPKSRAISRTGGTGSKKIGTGQEEVAAPLSPRTVKLGR